MSELVDVLLAESDLPDDAMLRDLLGELEREATAVAPMPSAALSELLNPRRSATDHARPARRRPPFAGRGAVITGVVVLGVLGLGAGAAAASPDARSAIGAGVAVIAHLFQPSTVDVPLPTEAPAQPGSAESPEPSTGPSTGPSAAPTPAPSDDAPVSEDPTSGAVAGSGGSDDSNSGKDSSKDSGDTHGNGKGNQSGHGNGKGRGNGGPAPTP